MSNLTEDPVYEVTPTEVSQPEVIPDTAPPDPFADMEWDDLAPRCVKVRIKDQHFVLLEASEDAVRIWRNAQLKATKIKDNQLAGVDGIADTPSVLVAECLCKAASPGVPLMRSISRNGREAAVEYSLVGIDFVRKLPAKIVSEMFKRVLTISGLNSPAGGTPSLFGDALKNV